MPLGESQCRHPSRQAGNAVGTHCTQCCVSPACLPAPRIHHLLPFPGCLSRLHWSHHARTARRAMVQRRTHVVIWGMLPAHATKAKNGRLPRSTASRASSRKISSSSPVVFRQTGATRRGYRCRGNRGQRPGSWESQAPAQPHRQPGRGTGTVIGILCHCDWSNGLGLLGLKQRKSNRLGCMGCGIGALDKMTVVSNACRSRNRFFRLKQRAYPGKRSPPLIQNRGAGAPWWNQTSVQRLPPLIYRLRQAASRARQPVEQQLPG